MENLHIYVSLSDEDSILSAGDSNTNQTATSVGDSNADVLDQILAQEEAQTAYIAFAVVIGFGVVIIYKVYAFVKHFL